jgi:hypothetical protein
VSHADPGFGIDVHWPFCRAICAYCDFNRHVSGPAGRALLVRFDPRPPDRKVDQRSRPPYIEAPHQPVWIAPLWLTLDGEGLAIDDELIVGARVCDLARAQLEGRGLGVDAGLCAPSKPVLGASLPVARSRAAPAMRETRFKEQ